MRTLFFKIFHFLLLVCLFSGAVKAQQKQKITLEDIWQKNTFAAKTVSGVDWAQDGRYYTSMVANNQSNATDIIRYNVTTGQPVATVVAGQDLKIAGSDKPIDFEEYTFSADEQRILFSTETEPIYRHSSRSQYYVYDVKTKTLRLLSTKGKQMFATFSPDGSRVAFVRDNNLFYVDLASNQEKQITTNGERNKIINGGTDWVYEEEFSFAQAFFWSPDGAKIAFYTFDESQVKQYTLQMWGPLYPQNYTFKYPKAGEANSVVSISVVDLNTNKTTRQDIGTETDIYIPRIGWTETKDLLWIQRMNRLQNTLEILHADVNTGKTNVALRLTDKAYIEITDDLKYLKNGKQFVISSDKDGYNHLYLYDLQGKQLQQLTKGNWDVTDVVGINEKQGLVYYLAAEVSPMEKQLYSVNLKGSNKKRLTEAKGTHRISMNPDFTYYLDYQSTANTPTNVSLHAAPSGKLVKNLEENTQLQAKLKQFNLSPLQFISFNTTENVKLNAYVIKPSNFDAAKKYPVLLFVYGGPGSQQVLDSWNSGNYFWFQMLAQRGYIVACVDNRGTGGRGAAFRKITYANLGHYETIDQIEGAKYFGSLPYVDKSRIGIWGWSFGGYMSSLALTKGADYFKTAIAVAPVTNWRYYDNIYTERYLKRPQENAAGYDENSPVTHVDKLKGKYLLIHGTGDDNVHFQNAVAMEDALIKANKQFESFYYPNRNHGISGGNTRLHLYTMMTNFLLKNL
ncbi:S9 family peptidase [Adhaeribacter pallidiroseus]|uniref:Dipeptidyl-peptidase IV n=1 Tax=Adhaeribacter pallidiroseus TaxID=2072847 RepID=A0A369QPZ4_9BACT|nr:S9 family peptidase [Adhaeribacter pallidiroseus]RDC65356.1 Dipeptidyl-peptidase IV [Adhaeribacter pallidiroseus]